MAAAAAKHDKSQKNYPDAAVIIEKITKTVIHKKSSLCCINQMGFTSSVNILCQGKTIVHDFFCFAPPIEYPTINDAKRATNETNGS